MLTEGDLHMISALPKTEYGQALVRWLESEIARLEAKEESGLKLTKRPRRPTLITFIQQNISITDHWRPYLFMD